MPWGHFATEETLSWTTHSATTHSVFEAQATYLQLLIILSDIAYLRFSHGVSHINAHYPEPQPISGPEANLGTCVVINPNPEP